FVSERLSMGKSFRREILLPVGRGPHRDDERAALKCIVGEPLARGDDLQSEHGENFRLHRLLVRPPNRPWFLVSRVQGLDDLPRLTLVGPSASEVSLVHEHGPVPSLDISEEARERERSVGAEAVIGDKPQEAPESALPGLAPSARAQDRKNRGFLLEPSRHDREDRELRVCRSDGCVPTDETDTLQREQTRVSAGLRQAWQDNRTIRRTTSVNRH